MVHCRGEAEKGRTAQLAVLHRQHWHGTTRQTSQMHGMTHASRMHGTRMIKVTTKTMHCRPGNQSREKDGVLWHSKGATGRKYSRNCPVASGTAGNHAPCQGCGRSPPRRGADSHPDTICCPHLYFPRTCHGRHLRSGRHSEDGAACSRTTDGTGKKPGKSNRIAT
jgi:hypothetical protein